jgi:ATP-dependent Clp protease protease subunit
MITLNVKRRLPDNAVIKEEKIMYVTEFTLESAVEFNKRFNELNSDDEVTVITIVISSYGGNVNALFSMIDVMSTSTKPIATIASGAAMSCGMLLLAAGTKGYRFSGPLAEIMIHEVSGGASGTTTTLHSDVRQTKKINALFFGLLSKYTGKPAKFFTDKLKASGNVDWYLTAKEAKALSLVDHAEMPILMGIK